MKLPFFSKDDGSLATSIKYVGIPCMAAAFAILSVPGFNDALLHFLSKRLGLQLDFNQSHAAGWVFLVIFAQRLEKVKLAGQRRRVVSAILVSLSRLPLAPGADGPSCKRTY